MKKLIVTSVTLILVVATFSSLAFPQGDYSQGRVVGFGVQYMANFPAPSGHNLGFAINGWLMNFLGIEFGAYPIPWTPSYTLRGFLKAVNTAMVDLYVGGGMGFFPYNYQILSGIEISPLHNFAFTGELGYAFLGSNPTAGVGVRLYF